MDLKILANFFIALAVGALLGIERQRGKKDRGFAGLRTFTLISFCGALGAYLYIQLDSEIFFLTLFISIILFVLASYVISAIKGYFGITSEISAILTFILGFLIMFDDYRNYSLIFGVVITILLSFKETLHNVVEKTKDFEWHDTLKFALIAFVILPILPQQVDLGIFSGQLKSLNIIHPKEIWLLIVFVSGISFIGYFLLKMVDQKKSLNLIGATGGIVSSTAVTQSMASHSRSKVNGKIINYNPLIISTLIAIIVALLRVFIIALSINSSLFKLIFPILLSSGMGFVFILSLRKKTSSVKTDLKLKSPFKLKPALILGLFYAVLTMLSKLSFALNLGKAGIFIGSLVTGFFDVDPVILTVSSLSVAGTLSVNEAIRAILMALCSNQLLKAFIGLTSGSKKFGTELAKRLLIIYFILMIFIILY